MSLSTPVDSLKNKFNQGLSNALTAMLVAIGFGDVLRAMRSFIYGGVPAASAYNLAAVQVIALPEDAKAVSINRAYARTTSAAGTLGELAVQAANATPADAQIAVTPSGDIAVLAASAYTAIDLDYHPAKGDVREFTLPVVPGTGVLTLPASYQALMLLEAEGLAGTVVEKKIVLATAGGAPATHNARLNVAKTTVQFAVADALTQARVKVLCVPKIDLHNLLEAKADQYVG